MRKILLGLAATAAIAAIAVAGSASAATPGTIDTTTYANGTSYHHVLTADYTCGTSADGKTNISFDFTNGNGSAGSGTLVPDTKGGGVFAFSGAAGDYGYTYGGTYDTTGKWITAQASAGFGGVESESYTFGEGGRTETQFGSVVGSFSDVPTCPAPEVPATVTGNHGEYVSGAAKAGVKGKDLAAIAKDVTKVGPYKG